MRLDNRFFQEDRAFEIVADRAHFGDENDAKELGIGLELEADIGDIGDVEVMGFGYFGRLSDEDLEFLAMIEAPTPSEDRDKSFWGINAELDLWNFELLGQVISGDEGAELDRLGWWIQPSLRIDLPGIEMLGGRWFTSVRPLLRYGTLRNDFTAFPDDDLTWNRKEWTAASILKIAPNTQLMAEYHWYKESPSRFGVRNDELLLHLRMSW